MPQELQRALLTEGALAGVSIEWVSRGDMSALHALVKSLASPDWIVGIGGQLLASCDDLQGYRSYAARRRGRYTLPATPYDVWTFAPARSQDHAFQLAETLKARLQSEARIAEIQMLFSYQGGKDLTGYRDGSANPSGDRALQAALIGDGPYAQGAFALVQRWLHFRDRFAALTPSMRDHTIGRSQVEDSELTDAPESAHIRRTDQEHSGRTQYVVRRSMPWGDARRHGLQFIAFSKDLGVFESMLARMMGDDDGIADALLGHSQCETGGYYFIPPVLEGEFIMQQPSKDHVALPAVEVAESQSIRLIVDSKRCIHSRNCVLARPDVFVPNVVGAWLHPELASAEELVEIAHNCPSGAIRYERLDGGRGEAAPMRNVVRVRENGPYAVHGQFNVAGREELRATLCRCGQSQSKPYCDGSHVGAGFRASGEAEAVSEPDASNMPREVTVQPIADGPLVVHGAVELVSGTGHTISRAPGPTLCRCGQSANKPFCDGSHARVGFRAPE